MNLKTVVIFLSLALIGNNAIASGVKLQDLLLQVDSVDNDISLKTPIPFVNSIELRLGQNDSFENGEGSQTERDNSGAISDIQTEKEFGRGRSRDLTLRIKVDNLTEYKLKRKLAKNQSNRKKILKGVNKIGDAQIITELYINLKLSCRKELLLKRLNTIYKDKVKVLKAKSRKGSADVVDYLDAENKLESSSLQLQKQKLRITNIVNIINSELATTYVVSDFSKNEKLLSVDYIESVVKEEVSNLGLSSKLKKFELEKIDILNKLNSEKRNKIVRFVDFRYQTSVDVGTSRSVNSGGDRDRSREDGYERRVGFRVGFNLPWVNSDLASVDKSLDHILKKRKAKKEYYSEVERFETLKDSLMSLIKGIKSLRRSKALSEARKVLKVYSKQKGTAPLRLLKLNEFIVFEKIKKVEYELELYTRFYQYVYETDRLKLANGQLVIKG